jgi:hypothetical protein
MRKSESPELERMFPGTRRRSRFSSGSFRWSCPRSTHTFFDRPRAVCWSDRFGTLWSRPRSRGSTSGRSRGPGTARQYPSTYRNDWATMTWNMKIERCISLFLPQIISEYHCTAVNCDVKRSKTIEIKDGVERRPVSVEEIFRNLSWSCSHQQSDFGTQYWVRILLLPDTNFRHNITS